MNFKNLFRRHNYGTIEKSDHTKGNGKVDSKQEDWRLLKRFDGKFYVKSVVEETLLRPFFENKDGKIVGIHTHSTGSISWKGVVKHE